MPKAAKKLTRFDPSRTGALRKAFVLKLRGAFKRIRGRMRMLLLDENALALVQNNRWQALSDTEKLKAFQRWLQQEIDRELSNEDLWIAYAKAGFEKGAGRAFDDVNKNRQRWKPGEGDFYKGSRAQFLRTSFGAPESVDKIKLLAARSFTDLENVTTDMATKMTRTLADGLARGANPLELAGELAGDMDSSLARAETVARTEIIRAHAEGQLKAFADLGVNELGVQVEWLVTDDDKLCPACATMEGNRYSLADASGLLPLHPNCRCAWLPAGDALTSNSYNRQEFWRRITANSLRINAFCPTGPGGGVDPSCSPKHKAEPSGMVVLKTLAGSTKPVLMKDSHGVKYVVKSGKTQAARQNEADADAAYRTLGIDVPNSYMSEGKKVSEFLEGAKTLQEWEQTASATDKIEMRAEIAKNFVADALLANWDVVGLSQDNILIVDGKPVRADNGGALAYRAQGAPKGDKFGATIGELKTMRDPTMSTAASIYKNLDESAIAKQIEHVLSKREDVLKEVTDPKTRETLGKRFDYLEDQLNAYAEGSITKFGDTPIPKPKDEDIPELELDTPEETASSVSKPDDYSEAHELVKDVKGLTKLQMLKLKLLNPGGLGKVVKVDALGPAQQAKLLEKLPPGTKIEKVSVTAAQLGIDKKNLGAPTTAMSKKPEPISASAGTIDFKDAAELHQHGSVYLNQKVPQDMRDHIVAYTGSGYAKLNETMRKCPPDFECVQGALKSRMDSINKAIEGFPKFAKPIRVVRGIDVPDATAALETYRKLVGGNSIQFPSLTSTSTGSGFLKDIRFVIEANHGLPVNGVSIYPGENEVILHSAARFRVTKVDGKQVYMVQL